MSKSIDEQIQEACLYFFGVDFTEPRHREGVDELKQLWQIQVNAQAEKEARIDELGRLRIPTQTLRDQVDDRLAQLREDND